MRQLLVCFGVILIVFGAANDGNAIIVWDWEFDTEAGQFITNGDLSGGMAAAGTYELNDFSVTSSYDSRLLGSWSAGDYDSGPWGADTPFSFLWDGSQVTQWLHSGPSAFDMWVFTSNNLAVHEYWIAWVENTSVPIGADNDPTKATLVDLSVSAGGNWIRAEGIITVTPSTTAAPIPEPTTILLLGTGLIGIVGLGRKKLFKKWY